VTLLVLPRGDGRGFMTPAKRPVLTFGSGMAHADESVCPEDHVFVEEIVQGICLHT
jgi:hypothetical protein